MERPGVNKNGWFWLAPQYIDQWRVWPRAFILFYFWLCMQTALWFMALPEPTNAQAGFAGAVISAGAAWFGLYVNSGPRPMSPIPPYFVGAGPHTDQPQPQPGTVTRRRRKADPEFEDESDEDPKG